MEWIRVKEQIPNTRDKIIGLCKDCCYPHLLYYDYDEWVMPEWCGTGTLGEKGYLTSGRTIHFDFWMPLPNPPDAI